MFQTLRNRHFFFSDLFLLPLAVYASYVLRLERFALENSFWMGLLVFALCATAVTTATFRLGGVYSRYWRYASVDEMLLLMGAVSVATFVSGAVSFLLLWLLPVNWVLPRSIPLIYLLLALAVTAVPRLAVRTWTIYERRTQQGLNMQRVLIMGAGDAGSMMAREMLQTVRLRMTPVGFVDDDPAKQGMRIHGIPVLGGREDIPALVNQFDTRQVIIALPTAPGKVVREIASICEKARVQTKIIPGIYELLDGTVSVNQLRDVDIEDLLRREAVQTDITAVQTLLHGKRVLITGGGGSIGSELCRQVLRCDPAELVIVGHGENSVFTIYHELRRLFPGAAKITPVIADVRFAERITAVLQRHRPQVVFHAAAHKHVPLMEMNPGEAITNNVQGTRNLLAAAQAADVQHFVMISTD
ncbi:MAG: polysaccharide biosynthesis protein, partial [Anaerolineales bacterium]|nr:polysaccharide biosynthesis protein [Anaerolineales bacterium]